MYENLPDRTLIHAGHKATPFDGLIGGDQEPLNLLVAVLRGVTP